MSTFIQQTSTLVALSRWRPPIHTILN